MQIVKPQNDKNKNKKTHNMSYSDAMSPKQHRLTCRTNGRMDGQTNY